MHPTDLPRRRRCLKFMVTCAVLCGFAAADAAAQDVVLRRDQLRRAGISDAALRHGATVLRQESIDTATVRADGITLQRGALLALPTGERLREVEGAAAPDTAQGASEPLGVEKFRALPFRLFTPDATGSGTWVLRPVIKIDRRLRWDAAAGAFRGRLAIAVDDSVRPREARPLPASVAFRVLGDADSVQPVRVEVARTNELHFIDVRTREADDSLRVHIVPDFNLEGHDVWVPVTPSLLIVSPPRIAGWGVGSAAVTIRVKGAVARVPHAATLATTIGELDTIVVAIGEAGSGTTRLRSAGIGPAIITASAPGYGDAQSTVEFTWPLAFVVAATIGSVFGGVTSAARKRGRRVRLRDRTLAAALGGLLGAVVWFALGINLIGLDLGMPRSNEIAVFAVAALGAYLGIVVVPKQKETGDGATT